MQIKHKLLFTCISAVLILIGMLAILTETHTGYARYQGVRTMRGDEAIWFGQTCLLLALLPLVVWLPRRGIGISIALWWVALMVWLFMPFLYR